MVPEIKEININHELKRTAKDSLIYLPARVIPAIVGIVLIRILTTIFTPAEYGYYQITLTTFGLIRVFSIIWLSTSVARFFLGYRTKSQENIFYSTLFFSTLVTAFGVAIVCLFANTFLFKLKISAPLYSLLNLAIIASIFTTFFEIFVVIYRAGLQPKKYSIFWILYAVGKPIIGIILILIFNFRVEGLIWGFLITPLLLDAAIFNHLKLYKYLKLNAVSISLLKQIGKYGIPICLSYLAFWVLTLSDRYLIELFRTSAEVGYYSVGYTISEKTLNFVYMILMLAAYPIIIDNWEKYGDEQTQKLITALTRYFFILCIPILTTLVTIPEQVLSIFSSTKFKEGAAVLPLIAFGIFVYGLTQYVIKGFELHKKSYMIAALALIAGVLNVSANFILIPHLGIIGASISACFANVLYFLLAVFFVRKELTWKPPIKSIVRILIAALAMGVFLKLIITIIENIFYILCIGIPCGLIIFFVTLILIKEIGIDEINSARIFVLRLLRVKE